MSRAELVDQLVATQKLLMEERLRVKYLGDALKDAISTYGNKVTILVTEERVETWKNVLEKHGPGAPIGGG